MEHNPYQILSGLSALSIGSWAVGGVTTGLGMPYFAGLAACAGHYAWQIKTLDIENRENCWNRFVANRWLGLMLVGSIMAGKHFAD